MPTPLSWPLNAPAVAPPVGETQLGFSALAYARQLKELLPPGSVWLLLPGSWISRALLAIGTELARIDARALELLEEADPRTTTELLTDWERVLGLPDGCVLELADTTAERRNSVVAKLVARGGQSAAFYISIAAAMGVTATVSESYANVLRVGFRVGDRVYGLGEAFTWTVNTTGGVASGLFLATPVITSVVRVAYIGGLGSGTYTYRVSALSAAGETLASTAVAGTALAINSAMRVVWTAVAGATGYKLYGRTGGTELLIATLGAVTTYDDHGTTPAGALPAANTALTEKALSLECIIGRAKPSHTTVLFEHAP